jgi:hypothetical protein
MKKRRSRYPLLSVWMFATALAFGSCANSPVKYHDPNMDFSSVRTIAVMPFANLTPDKLAGERVRDAWITALLATESIYVLPTGEVARGTSRTGIADPTSPSVDEIKKLGGILKVNAVITGVVREYGEVRSGTTSANVVSISMTMLETDTGRIVWTASSTKGGIGMWDRMFGGGGEPMNTTVRKVVDEIMESFFK